MHDQALRIYLARTREKHMLLKGETMKLNIQYKIIQKAYVSPQQFVAGPI